MKASETQVSGNHYKDYAIQPAEFCQRNRLNWCEANAVKYVCRHAKKKGAEDIDKAIHYLQLLKEWEYGETAREAMQPLPESVMGGLGRSLYLFPCAEKFMGYPAPEYIDKLREEVQEVAKAMTESDAMMELFDVIHAAETAVRSLSERWGVNPEEQMQRVIAKNAERGYYDKPQEAL